MFALLTYRFVEYLPPNSQWTVILEDFLPHLLAKGRMIFQVPLRESLGGHSDTSEF